MHVCVARQDMPQPSPACTMLRYHMRDIVRSLRRNIVTPRYFLRQAARVIFDEKAMLGFPPQMKAEFLRAMFSLEQSGEVSDCLTLYVTEHRCSHIAHSTSRNSTKTLSKFIQFLSCDLRP